VKLRQKLNAKFKFNYLFIFKLFLNKYNNIFEDLLLRVVVELQIKYEPLQIVGFTACCTYLLEYLILFLYYY